MTVSSVFENFFQKRDEILAHSKNIQLVALSNWLRLQLKTLPAPEAEISDKLRQLAEGPKLHDARSGNANLWIIAAQLHPSLQYFTALCTLLEREGEAINYEGIVDLLYDLKDERAVPSLVKALSYQLDYDPTKELQIKILETLAYIGTPQAISIVQNYLQSPVIGLRETAEILLKED